jgi:hypothetical protein
MSVKFLSDFPAGRKMDLLRELLTDVTNIRCDEVVLVFKEGDAHLETHSEIPTPTQEAVEDIGVLDVKPSEGTKKVHDYYPLELLMMRANAFLSVEEWAKKLGVSPTVVRNYETFKPISRMSLKRIEKHLGLHLHNNLFLTPHPPKAEIRTKMDSIRNELWNKMRGCHSVSPEDRPRPFSYQLY